MLVGDGEVIPASATLHIFICIIASLVLAIFGQVVMGRWVLILNINVLAVMNNVLLSLVVQLGMLLLVVFARVELICFTWVNICHRAKVAMIKIIAKNSFSCSWRVVGQTCRGRCQILVVDNLGYALHRWQFFWCLITTLIQIDPIIWWRIIYAVNSLLVSMGVLLILYNTVFIVVKGSAQILFGNLSSELVNPLRRHIRYQLSWVLAVRSTSLELMIVFKQKLTLSHLQFGLELM